MSLYVSLGGHEARRPAPIGLPDVVLCGDHPAHPPHLGARLTAADPPREPLYPHAGSAPSNLLSARDEEPERPGPSRAAPGGTEVHEFVALYRANYEQLCRFAFRYVRSRHDAEEIVHDVFLRLWTRGAREDRDATIAAWAAHQAFAYAAVRNEAIDRLRRRRREALAIESADGRVVARDEGAAGTLDEVAEADVAAEIQWAVDELPARVREVLLLKWQRGMTNAQVAEALGIARKTVEMHVTRAARALRALLRQSPRGWR